jgi:hypothetical protein
VIEVVVAKLEVDIEALAVMSVVWPVAAAVENAELEVAAEVVIGAVVTKFEVDNEALAAMSVAWPVLATVENAEAEVADERAAEVSRQHFVAGSVTAMEVAVAVGVSVEKFVEEFVAE